MTANHCKHSAFDGNLLENMSFIMRENVVYLSHLIKAT